MNVRPAGKRVFFLVPFVPEGISPGGVWISHDRRIPAIFGRVTQVHASCRVVRVGDWVVFEPDRPVRLKWSGGYVYALRENVLLAVVMPPDGLPWFNAAPKGDTLAVGNGRLSEVNA